MPFLDISNAACFYLVTSFEVVLASRDADTKKYTGSNSRICNEVLMSFDCSIIEYRNRMEAVTARIAKQSADSISPELSSDVLQALHAKFSQILSSELESLAQGEGRRVVKVELNETLLRWLREEWLLVNHPSNYKQRSLATEISSSLEHSSAG